MARVRYVPNVSLFFPFFLTELPLTSVEFASDGTNLVLGTTQGLVYLYDLRYFNNPSAVIGLFHLQVVHEFIQKSSIFCF